MLQMCKFHHLSVPVGLELAPKNVCPSIETNCMRGCGLIGCGTVGDGVTKLECCAVVLGQWRSWSEH